MAPIHNAAREVDVDALRRLLLEGVSPNLTDDHDDGRTPLHNLCFYDDSSSRGDRAACFKLLRDAGANLEAVSRGEYTALHHAAGLRDCELVSLLVEAGANVNAANASGWTALHFAAWRAADCVEVLLAAGADIVVRGISGRRPLDIALKFNSRRAWPLFLRAGAELPWSEHFIYPWSEDPYIVRVRNAGGFNKYAQAHLARVTNTFEPKLPMLPKELVRHVVSFWLHAGYY